MSVFSSLTNRIFIASAVLVLGSIAVPVYFVTGAVTEQANAELERGLDEAAALVNDYVSQRFENFVQAARTVADLPLLKAAVAEDHPPTVAPIALEYEKQIQADLFVVIGGTGRILASVGPVTPSPDEVAEMLKTHLSGKETWFRPYSGGILRIAALPLAIQPMPDRLGTLIVGFGLDRATQRIKTLTNSDLVVVVEGTVVSSTLDAARRGDLASAAANRGVFPLQLGGEEYIGRAQPLGSSGDPTAIVLRSRTAQLAFLRQFHRQVAVTGLAAVLIATLLGYALARTVTRPLRAVTATMREIAATGDLARAVPAGRPWDDEDARLLATTFRQLTTALNRFQREVSQRERLSSLGRLSTVVAHEVRNPLMIIKAALRNLRHASPDVVEVADSINEEVNRINHVVSDVLDFARPIKFAVQSADLTQICRDAAQAARVGADEIAVAVEAGEDPAPVVTDAERVRGVLVNLLTNAQYAVRAKGQNGSAEAPIRIRTARAGRHRWRIEVADRGIGIAPADLSRVFEPFYTTRRTGSGLGLALARNIVEGLGGSIVVESQVNRGTTVRIELPDKPSDASTGA